MLSCTPACWTAWFPEWGRPMRWLEGWSLSQRSSPTAAPGLQPGDWRHAGHHCSLLLKDREISFQKKRLKLQSQSTFSMPNTYNKRNFHSWTLHFNIFKYMRCSYKCRLVKILTGANVLQIWHTQQVLQAWRINMTSGSCSNNKLLCFADLNYILQTLTLISDKHPSLCAELIYLAEW